MQGGCLGSGLLLELFKVYGMLQAFMVSRKLISAMRSESVNLHATIDQIKAHGHQEHPNHPYDSRRANKVKSIFITQFSTPCP